MSMSCSMSRTDTSSARPRRRRAVHAARPPARRRRARRAAAPWGRGEGRCDLDLSLLAIGKRRDAFVHDVPQREPREDVRGRRDDGSFASSACRRARRRPALRDHKRNHLQGRHCAEELIDLEGAGHPALDARLATEAGNIRHHEMRPAVGEERSGQQVDESGLASPLGPDEPVNVARLSPSEKRDIVRRSMPPNRLTS